MKNAITKLLITPCTKFSKWWEARFLGLEMRVALILALAFGVWGMKCHGNGVIDNILTGNRGAIYTALASISGALFGFIITALSIVLGFSTNEKLKNVQESDHYIDLWNVFSSCMRVLSLATISALIGLVFDRDPVTNTTVGPNWYVLYVCFGFLILSVFRLMRCVWVLNNIVDIITAPSQARSAHGK